MMETCKYFIILLYCVSGAYSHPLKPLNERDLALPWKNWLLLDEQQNQNKQPNSDAISRKRITAKSVFVVPSFAPEPSQSCAEGLTLNLKGNCVSIIKMNEDAYKQFLLRTLNNKFRYSDYDYETEEEDNTEKPLKIDIPLQVSVEEPDEEADVAIVMPPTKAFEKLPLQWMNMKELTQKLKT